MLRRALRRAAARLTDDSGVDRQGLVLVSDSRRTLVVLCAATDVTAASPLTTQSTCSTIRRYSTEWNGRPTGVCSFPKPYSLDQRTRGLHVARSVVAPSAVQR